MRTVVENNAHDQHYLKGIAARFQFEGEFVSAQPYGTGHINDTYAVRVRLKDGETRRYILQRINQEVFKDPIAVMENLMVVSSYLQERIVEAGGDPLRETINLVPTREGTSYLMMERGDVWRGEVFIEGAQTYLLPADPRHYYQAAAAFGRFGNLLEGYPVDRLEITIPDFHNTPKRFTRLAEAVNHDPCGRVEGAKWEIDFFFERQEDLDRLVRLGEAGTLPQRVTHNDTKFENVMIDDRTGEGICVIDLDTVMPGLVVFDFADTVRSGANPAAEDEPELSKVQFDIEIYRHLVRGYLAGSGGFLTQPEVDNLAFTARLITLEQGIRFLTDHLSGDVYYRIQRPGHNLDRCRTQVKMVEGMEAQFERMEEIVREFT